MDEHIRKTKNPENFSFYRSIYIVSIERKKSSAYLLLEKDYKVYVNPSSEMNNPKIPNEVEELFKAGDEDVVEFGMYRWERWGPGCYTRKRYVQSDLILRHVNPYLDRLGSLEGKVISPPDVIFPKFERDNFGFFVPNTNFLLGFYQGDEKSLHKKMNLDIWAVLGVGPSIRGAERPLNVSPATTLMSIEYDGLQHASQ